MAPCYHGTCDGSGLLTDLSACACLLDEDRGLLARVMRSIPEPTPEPVAVAAPMGPLHGPLEDTTLPRIKRTRNPWGRKITMRGSRSIGASAGSRIRRRLRDRGPYTGRPNRWA